MTYINKTLKILPVLFLFSLYGCYFSEKKVKTTPKKSVSSESVSQNSTFVKKNDIYQIGIASWYGDKFHGKRTSNGEIYDMHKLTAAHKKLPFNTIVEVENLNNRKKVLVRINDRGPFVKERIIDLSNEAARILGIDELGTAPVALRIVKPEEYSLSGKIEFKGKKEVGKMIYYLQAGAFRDIKNAESLLFKINEISGDNIFKIIFEGDYYKVISDNYISRNLTENQKNILSEKGFDVIVKEKQD